MRATLLCLPVPDLAALEAARVAQLCQRAAGQLLNEIRDSMDASAFSAWIAAGACRVLHRLDPAVHPRVTKQPGYPDRSRVRGHDLRKLAVTRVTRAIMLACIALRCDRLG